MTIFRNKMDANEFLKFTERGYLTIIPSDKLWSEIWSDIKQVLIRSMESYGGLTHGRRVTDSVFCRSTEGILSI